MMRANGWRGRTGWRRRAAAVVELAVVMPLLIMLLLGIMEYGRRFMVNQTLIQAAREGCRTAVLQGSTEADVRARINTYMTAAGLPTYTVSIARATTADPTETVVVSVLRSNISLFGSFFGSTAGTMSSSCSMRKEG